MKRERKGLEGRGDREKKREIEREKEGQGEREREDPNIKALSQALLGLGDSFSS